MSRSALWRQEGNAKERERKAEDIFENVVEEGRQRSAFRSVLPLWGPDNTFHINPLLLKNTIHSAYFQKCCETLSDWNAVIDEIYYEVKHLQPFSNEGANHSKSPSTAFCLLLRLLTLRMTDHQLDLTLKHADSPYIRGIGFLYLRYAGPPDQIMEIIEPHLYDDEGFTVEAGQKRGSTTITMGEFVRELFRSREFHGTPLPRFPVEVEREIHVRLLQAEKVAERAANHYKNQQRLKFFQTLGSEVMALYGDDENPITWYEAVVDRVITRDDKSGQPLRYPKFVVTFTGYGNTETVMLGEMDTIDGNWKQEDLGRGATGNRGGRGGRHERQGEQGWGRSKQDSRGYEGRQHNRRSNNDRDLYDEVRQRERNTATADKGWARRPPTTKSALSSKVRGENIQDDDNYQQRTWVPARQQQDQRHKSAAPFSRDSGSAETTRKRSSQEMAAIQEKKQKLLAKYG